MAITKEQWANIEQELSHPFGRVKMKCDGYELALAVQAVAALQYGIAVYVNGYFKGKWIVEDCEERRRFMRPVERFLWTAKQRCEMLKIYGGKRAQKKDVERINAKFTSYHSCWTSVKSLRRHLEKNNQELELLEIGSVKVTQAEASPTLGHELVAASGENHAIQ